MLESFWGTVDTGELLGFPMSSLLSVVFLLDNPHLPTSTTSGTRLPGGGLPATGAHPSDNERGMPDTVPLVPAQLVPPFATGGGKELSVHKGTAALMRAYEPLNVLRSAWRLGHGEWIAREFRPLSLSNQLASRNTDYTGMDTNARG